uniref:Uncharacterized protein n=1 Tax=Alexandrium monilatum TaxID=311494 RepID=A0A7S4SDN8_9DINO
MSGYFHGRHDCGRLLRAVAPGCRNQDASMLSEACRDVLKVSLQEVERYAECVGSTQTRMLAGASLMGPATPGHQRTAPDVIESIRFVGLAEEYDLSVCLFHSMFGGACKSVEFQNMRPGPRRQKSKVYDVSMSAKVESSLRSDTITYDAARRRFWRDVKQHNVTGASCAMMCSQPPELFGREAAP